jgi:hypothetical protein
VDGSAHYFFRTFLNHFVTVLFKVVLKTTFLLASKIIKQPIQSNQDVSFTIKHDMSYFQTINRMSGLLSNDEECVEHELFSFATKA